MDDLPTIPEFYTNKSIFITGGSGFIGKVLVEKLLRSCPKLKNIYLLLRPKKGQTPEERIKAITDLPLFDVLKSQHPSSLDKIKVIKGEVTELGLGLTSEDRKLLIEEVNVIVHSAASVRFDDPLKEAIFMNTRGTRELVLLALEMKNLEVFLHISTTYCNTDRQVICEQIYPPHADWRKTIDIAENIDQHTLDVLTSKYISPLPNTYTFTKSLAEHVVYDLCKGKIPTVIFRPSIVISTAQEPFTGWIDNFNGPVGLLIACGKGVIRTVYSDPDIIADYVPVDITVKAILMATWKKAVTKNQNEKLETTFYNGSNNNIHPTTMGEIVQMGTKICWEIPFNTVLWYPSATVTRCYYYHMFKFFFYQLLPAALIDGFLKVTGNKTMLLKVQRRIHVVLMALQYFAHNQWTFINDNVLNLEKIILPSDYEAFAYKTDEVESMQYFKLSTIGGRRYLLGESDDTLEQARKNARRMWVAAKVFDFVWYMFLLWLIFVKIDVVSWIFKKYDDACLYLTTD